jgi:hypothetical protein
MKSFKLFLNEAFSDEEAKHLGNKLGVDWDSVSLVQFKMGLAVEKEHDDGSKLDVVDGHLDLAKIVLAHLKEDPKYYTKLKTVEEDAPANSIAAGGIAGMREPIIRLKKHKNKK